MFVCARFKYFYFLIWNISIFIILEEMLRRCFTLNLNKNNKYLTLSRYESTQDKALKQQKVEEGIPKEPQNYGMTDRGRWREFWRNYFNYFHYQVINTSKSDKYMIKWFGKTKYKSVDDVPDQIP